MTNSIQTISQATITSNIQGKLAMTELTQVEQLIEAGKNKVTPLDAARKWLTTNLTTLPTLETNTLTSDQWYMSTVFGIVTEMSMSTNGVLRLITAHEEELEMPALNTDDYSDNALVKDARMVMNALKKAGLLYSSKKKMTGQLDGKTITWYIHAATGFFTKEIEEITEELRESATMVCKPLYEQPTDWTRTNGFVKGPGNLKAVKGQSLVTSAVLESLNKVQSVAFRYSEDIMDLVDDMLTNGEHDDAEQKRILDAIDAIEGQGKFFFPVTFDFRGRMYYRGGLLTPQGEKIVKALLEFHTGVALGEYGMKWLTIHLANTLGFDKKSIKNRIKSVDAVHEKLMSVEDNDDMLELFPNADKFTSFVACLDYQKAVNAPVTAEYVSHLILHIDGTNNGLQHASVITKDRSTAEAVNITESTEMDEVRDLYDDVVSWALEQTMTPESRALMITHGRDLGKPVVMLKGYGAGDATTIEGIEKECKRKGIAMPAKNLQEIGELLIEALTSNAGAVSKLVNAMKRLAKKFGGNVITWTTADGFKVVQEYRDFTAQERRVGDLSIRIAGEGEDDLIKAQTALAPNFVHSMDATHLRLLARRTDAPLALVHDSVGAHAGNMQEVAQKVRETFVELHSFDQVATIVESMGAKKAPNFKGDYSVQEALTSTYIFS
jgi:hypothetical protein